MLSNVVNWYEGYIGLLQTLGTARIQAYESPALSKFIEPMLSQHHITLSFLKVVIVGYRALGQAYACDAMASSASRLSRRRAPPHVTACRQAHQTRHQQR